MSFNLNTMENYQNLLYANEIHLIYLASLLEIILLFHLII